MIIDFHTHIFPPEISVERDKWLATDPLFQAMYGAPRARIATADELLESMDRSGVDVSVVVGFAWRDVATCRRHNDYLLEAADRANGRLIPFCTVQPGAGDDLLRDEIRRCVGLGARGLGELRPDDQGFHLGDSSSASTLAALAQEHNLVLLFHVTEPVGHAYPGKKGLGLGDFAAFVAANPGCKIVGAHWGGGLPFYALMPEVLASLANTWFDTAASRYLYDPRIYQFGASLAGTGRILFGSDFPLIDQKTALSELRRSGLDAATVSAISGENAALLLGLE